MGIQALSYSSGQGILITAQALPTSNQTTTGNRQRSTSTAGTSGKSNQYHEKMDLNQGGYVSSLEEYFYALMHPGEVISLNIYTQYDSTGNLTINTSGMPRLINITV